LKKIEIDLLTPDQVLQLPDAGSSRSQFVRRPRGGWADGGRRRINRRAAKPQTPPARLGPPLAIEAVRELGNRFRITAQSENFRDFSPSAGR
jgi:hypothetical protein